MDKNMFSDMGMRITVGTLKESLDADDRPYPEPVFSFLCMQFTEKADKAISKKIDQVDFPDQDEFDSILKKIATLAKMDLKSIFYNVAMKQNPAPDSWIRKSYEDFSNQRADLYAQFLVDMYGLQRACSYLPPDLKHRKAAELAEDKGMANMQKVIQRSLMPGVK